MSGMFYLLNYKLFKKIMRNNIGLWQILVLLLLCFLLFGDFSKLYSVLKKFLTNANKEIKSFFSENSRRKGN